MKYEQFSELCVAEIMQRWPPTMGVFIDFGMHCVGCPIAVFHTLADAADEHGLSLAELAREVEAAIEGETRAGPARVRRRAAAGGAGLSAAASVARLQPGPHSPRR
ncbi:MULTISPECIES: DUF1858 domain-containing protein [unclassified Devosia]|uniref:DUF1858 domain-containing protein n=1 Tax=unclassified Devosia TaxID=196773 RepID=UPI001AC5FF40|nr:MULTISPECIES: DUF1858 domain-containing protein [unclassified Devosia]MBN9364226.1 DUF1858 domain-containing protein [Devosia sp.]